MMSILQIKACVQGYDFSFGVLLKDTRHVSFWESYNDVYIWLYGLW